MKDYNERTARVLEHRVCYLGGRQLCVERGYWREQAWTIDGGGCSAFS